MQYIPKSPYTAQEEARRWRASQKPISTKSHIHWLLITRIRYSQASVTLCFLRGEAVEKITSDGQRPLTQQVVHAASADVPLRLAQLHH